MVSSLSDREAEDYLVLILSDSNLPTGGFIASAGLESYYSHGFLTHGQEQLVSSTLSFVEHTLANYATSVLPYMCAAASRVKSAIAPSSNSRRQAVSVHLSFASC